MAPKSGEKKPAKKVVKKTGASAGDKKKKVSRKAVESYKIYIYKVRARMLLRLHAGLCCDVHDVRHQCSKHCRCSTPPSNTDMPPSMNCRC